jgi:hypothetical protein
VGDRLLGERRGGALSNFGGPPYANIVHLGKETEEKKENKGKDKDQEEVEPPGF